MNGHLSNREHSNRVKKLNLHPFFQHCENYSNLREAEKNAPHTSQANEQLKYFKKTQLTYSIS